MRKYTYLLSVFLTVIFVSASHCEEKRADPYQLFYTANHSYELRDYAKAVEGYEAILGSNLESGNLYYNLGNGFLKMGKLGKALLYYEKAKRLIPNDSDLKANLSYARSLVENASEEYPRNIILRATNIVFGSYSLRAVMFSATILYFILIALIGLFIVKPFFARRFRIILFVTAVLFLLNLSAAAVRFFDENMLKHGIILQKDVDCKYEPIEKSTTYYTLHEGGEVLILKARNGWVQIRRPDRKIGWVQKDSVEVI